MDNYRFIVILGIFSFIMFIFSLTCFKSNRNKNYDKRLLTHRINKMKMTEDQLILSKLLQEITSSDLTIGRARELSSEIRKKYIHHAVDHSDFTVRVDFNNVIDVFVPKWANYVFLLPERNSACH